jgi:hypothetical protein
MGILGQIHVGPRVPDVGLPQLRVAGMRENLVHTAARHHIAARKHGHYAIAHLLTVPGPGPEATPGLAPWQPRPVHQQATQRTSWDHEPNRSPAKPGLMNTSEPLTQIRSSCAPVLSRNHADMPKE